MPSSQETAVLTELGRLNGLYTAKLLPISRTAQSLVNTYAYSADRVEATARAIFDDPSSPAAVAAGISVAAGSARIAGQTFASVVKAALSQATVNFQKAKGLLRASTPTAYASLATVRRLRTTTDALLTALSRLLDGARVVTDGLGWAWVVAGAALALVVVAAALVAMVLEKLVAAREASAAADRRCAELAARGEPCDWVAIRRAVSEQEAQTGVTGLTTSVGEAIESIAPDIGDEVEGFFDMGKTILAVGALGLGAYFLWTTYPAARTVREDLRYRAERRAERGRSAYR